MKHRLFTIVALALLVAYIFGGSAMANDLFESLAGTWVEVDPERKASPFRPLDSSPSPYKILIDGDKITITWSNKIICDTLFRLDGNELKNTKKRQNWQEYVEFHQYEQFGPFERIELLEGVLTGFLFVADMGYVKFPFAKLP